MVIRLIFSVLFPSGSKTSLVGLNAGFALDDKYQPDSQFGFMYIAFALRRYLSQSVGDGFFVAGDLGAGVVVASYTGDFQPVVGVNLGFGVPVSSGTALNFKIGDLLIVPANGPVNSLLAEVSVIW